MPLPPVEHDLRRALAKQKSSKRSHFARREGWRCSTGSSVPLGDAAAPERTKRDTSPSRGTEIGLQTYRSSRRVHSVWGFESPTISMVFRKWNWLARQRTIFFFFQAYRVAFCHAMPHFKGEAAGPVGRMMSSFGQSPLENESSPEVQNIPHSFHAAVWSQKKSCVWHGMVDVCDGCLAAEASGSSFGC